MAKADKDPGPRAAALYIPRVPLQQSLDAFLSQEEKPCYVLAGGSGSGKSYALQRYFLQGRGALFHECGSATPRRLMASLRTAKPIVVFDAINEHENPSSLIELIREVLAASRKVVLSTRNSFWKLYKHEFNIADRVFTSPASRNDASFVLQGYDHNEAPSAYQAYQKVYGIMPDYAVLSGKNKAVLANPILLQLAAEAYAGQHLPDVLLTTQLYGKCVEMALDNHAKHEAFSGLMRHMWSTHADYVEGETFDGLGALVKSFRKSRRSRMRHDKLFEYCMARHVLGRNAEEGRHAGVGGFLDKLEDCKGSIIFHNVMASYIFQLLHNPDLSSFFWYTLFNHGVGDPDCDGPEDGDLRPLSRRIAARALYGYYREHPEKAVELLRYILNPYRANTHLQLLTLEFYDLYLHESKAECRDLAFILDEALACSDEAVCTRAICTNVRQQGKYPDAVEQVMQKLFRRIEDNYEDMDNLLIAAGIRYAEGLTKLGGLFRRSR